MKKNIVSLIIAVLALMPSCDSSFLDRSSLNEISETALWKTEDDAIQAINSLYETNKTFNNSICIYGFMDDFTDISYQSWATGLTTGSYPTNAGLYLDTWTTFYRGIYRANTALRKLPDMNISEDIKNRCLGEAYFFRGYFYFKLCDFFGGVPIYDSPVDVKDAYKPRDTESAVYDFVVEDMTKAYELLPSEYPQADMGRATKWAAMSMRGKAHLWNKRYAEAAEDFKTVMTQSGRKLHPDYGEMFQVEGNNNSEVIFDVQYIEVQGHGLATNKWFGFTSAAISGGQRCRPTNELVNAYEMKDGTPFSFANFTNAEGKPFDPSNAKDWEDAESVKKLYENRDPRLGQSVVVPWSTFKGKNDVVYTYKWPVTTDADQLVLIWPGNYAYRKFVPTGQAHALDQNAPINFPLIRLADVMLMYAEAQNEASGADGTVYDAVNQVRARAGMPGLPTGLSKEQMRDRIRHERMVELCGEGMRFSDLRRWRIAKEIIDGLEMRPFCTATSIRKRGFPDNFYYWPIPQAEIDLNPALEQNPYWN